MGISGHPDLILHLQIVVSPYVFEVHYVEPSEFLWKKVKTNATHNRYFAEFVKLVQSVEDAMAILSTQADEIKCLMGVYVKKLADPLPA